ncbi:hypothetical protein ACFX1T_013081 [Malus domestica]
MMSGAFSILFLCSFLEFRTRPVYPFHQEVGCQSGLLRFKEKNKQLQFCNKFATNQNVRRPNWSMLACWVKGWTWITDNLDHLYSCPCGLSCLWTKSYVLVNKHDALLFETTTPPL